ncbi:MAG: FxLYD domain-containing protein [Caldilineaceae bacterium]
MICLRSLHINSHQTVQNLTSFSWQAVGIGFTFVAMLLLAGCGQVITLTPTPTIEPSPTLDVNIAVATLPPSATPAPYTPEPTPTPTVTPTPIVHVIQSGESLLSIAGKYGISVAELQDSNGILDPRTLQIGQQLIIPRPEEKSEEGDSAFSTPTPTPLPMEVTNVFLSNTSIGGLFVLGEVVNTSDQSLEQVRVAVTLVDDTDQEISTSENLVAVDLIDSGKKAPFAILFGEMPPRFAKFRAYVTHAVPAYVGSYYRDLEVRDLKNESERYASYTVSGSIANIGPEEATDVQVILTAYDGLGRVIATRKVEPEYTIVPRGSATNFSAILAPVGGPVERVEAIAQGRRK